MEGITVLNETHEAIWVAFFQRSGEVDPLAWLVVVTPPAMVGDPHELEGGLEVVARHGANGGGARATVDLGARLAASAGPTGVELRREPATADPSGLEVHNASARTLEARVARGGHDLLPPTVLAPGETARFTDLDRWYLAVVRDETERGDRLRPEVLVSHEAEIAPGQHAVITGSHHTGLSIHVR